MRNQVVELVITLIVVVVAVWALARVLAVVNVPEPWGSTVLVVVGAAVVVWSLRALKG